MRKIVFITGTRADYGKLKPLMKATEALEGFETYIYVSGMHLMERYGNTYNEIQKDNYKNVYLAFGQCASVSMSYNLGDIICNFTGYVEKIKPDLIIVHGDRIDALAGAIVGALNNVRVAHVEGGEVSGTIDESIRHSVTKMSHFHLVSTNDAKKRVLQMGESEKNIFVIGSPDIDIMLSENLPSLEEVRLRYNIKLKKYYLFMYHPVTTEYEIIGEKISEVLGGLVQSNESFVVIYPNNDLGSEIIIHEINEKLTGERFRIFPSIRFEYFLTLLKNAEGIIGNSSCGIREASVYGVPAIDIGSRQNGRYDKKLLKNVQWVSENGNEIVKAVKECREYRSKTSPFGAGNSAKLFIDVLKSDVIWNTETQKYFVDR